MSGNDAYRIGALALALAVSTACTDQTSPTALLAPQHRRNTIICDDPSQPDCAGSPTDPPPSPLPGIVYSSGFYKGSDGYYYWDGVPPTGDLGNAIVSDARATAGSPDMEHDGYAKGYMVYSHGDEAKLALTVDAWQGNTRLIGPSAPISEEWQPCGVIGGFGHCQNESHQLVKNLGLTQYNCGVLVSVGGAAYAHKTLPFGIRLDAPIKWIGGSMPILSAWGEGSAFLRPNTDPGIACTGGNPPPAAPTTPPESGTGYAPGSSIETVPTSNYWTFATDTIVCQVMEYHYRYSDGSVSPSWYGLQC